MVSSVHYVATTADHHALLDHLGEPDVVVLAEWPRLSDPVVALTREQALARAQVMIMNPALGQPVGRSEADLARPPASRADVFDQRNARRLSLAPGQTIVDGNRSPVLLWTPVVCSDGGRLGLSTLGSQADTQEAISSDYRRWVSRAESWVRRRGTRIWGLERCDVRPDLDVRLDILNSVHALPEALRLLESGSILGDGMAG